MVGVDVDARKLEALGKGRMPFDERGFQEILDAALARRQFTISDAPVEADAYLLCVPSPITVDKAPDLSYVDAASESILPVVHPGDLVILESTVPVHATRDHVAKHLPSGVLVAHCPETVVPGNILHEIVHNHRVVGGITPEATTAALQLYRSVVDAPIYGTDAATAEFVKLIENTYRDVNIALANELNLLGHELGIDARAAIALANHHPRVHLHAPGPGVGGHCIPVDPWFLIQAASNAQLMRTARAINDSMPEMVARTVERLVQDRENPHVAILGLAYKGAIADLRGSPSLELIQILARKGVTTSVHDPYAPDAANTVSLGEAVAGSDCIVVMTDHPEFSTISWHDLRGARTLQVLDCKQICDKLRAATPDPRRSYHVF